jgi:hypothetical protein
MRSRSQFAGDDLHTQLKMFFFAAGVKDCIMIIHPFWLAISLFSLNLLAQNFCSPIHKQEAYMAVNSMPVKPKAGK